MSIKKIDLVVTRHNALVEYLIEEGVVDPDVKVIPHATPEQIAGKHVCGVLPHSLSCLASAFTEVPLVLPPELRGKELTVDDIRNHAKEPQTYCVTAL